MILDTRIPLGYIFKNTWKDILIVLSFSTLTYVTSLYIDFPPIPIGIPSFLGTAISLILAFKLAQSYDRWWEARKIWGAIVNDSRTLILQVKSFSVYDRQSYHPIARKMALRQIGWTYSLGQSLRKQNPFNNLDKFINEEELQELQKHTNVPLSIMQLHSKDLKQLLDIQSINTYQQVQLDQTLVRLVASMGQAERIKNTVFPTTYRIYLHLFIYLFLGFLSISLVELEGAWQIIVLTLISVPFMLLEKTAKHLQDPFEGSPTDTPVTNIARNIEINLKQLMNEDGLPDELPDHIFYVM